MQVLLWVQFIDLFTFERYQLIGNISLVKLQISKLNSVLITISMFHDVFQYFAPKIKFLFKI